MRNWMLVLSVMQNGTRSGKNDPGEVDREPIKKKVPAKVMWYFPVIPRLKRFFKNKSNAKLMQWHKEERKQDRMLRHPADGSQWRNVDRDFPDFDNDPRYMMMPVLIQGPKQLGNDIDVYLRPLVDELLLM